ncbi:MAG TPA: pre-peptidase C-terminal domain-containing protein [Rhizomicrobium sp.]
MDYFTVMAPNGTNSLNLSVTPASGLDTYVELYDSSGHLLKGFNTVGVGGTDTLSNFSVTGGATYYVGVSSISSMETGAYTINADFNPDQISKPNLTASLTSNPPSQLSPGNSFNIGYSLHNTTSTSAGQFLATFYISPDSTFGDSNDLALATISEGGLAGNASISDIETLILPSTAGSGTWYIALVADKGGGFPNGEVDETNETDNISNIYSFNVTASPAIVTLSGVVTDTNEGSGQPLVFDVNLDRLTTQDVTVTYQVGGTASSSDYQPLTGSVTITAGSSFAAISVYAIADGIPDDNETVTITLTGVSTGSILGSSVSATGTIHDGTAGSSDDFADSPTDTTAPIGVLPSNGSLTGFIGPADADDTYGDKDLFQVTLQQGHTYDIEMKSTSVNGHSLPLDIFTVRDGGNFSHIDSTSAISSDTTVAFTADESGTYYVLAGTGGAATDQGGYTISVADITPPPSTADDFPNYPGGVASNPIEAIAMGGSRTGSIESEGDKDVFTVSVKAGHTYQFSLSGESFLGSNGTLESTYLTVRDGDDFDIVLTQGGNGSLTTLSYAADSDETLYLRVGAGGNQTGIGGYEVGVSDSGPTPAPTAPPTQTSDPVADATSYAQYMVSGLFKNTAKFLFDDSIWDTFAALMFKLNNDIGAVNFADSVKKLGILDVLGVGLNVAEAVDAAPSGEKVRAAYVAFVDGCADALVTGLATFGGEVAGGFTSGVAGSFVPVAGTFAAGLFGVAFGGFVAGETAHAIYEATVHDWVISEAEKAFDYISGSSNVSPNGISLLDTTSPPTVVPLDDAQIVRFDQDWYLSTYADAAAAVANGTAGSAYAYFLTVGIDKGEQPNAVQSLTRADLAVSIINNDPNALGNSALTTQPLGSYAGDGISPFEQAVADGINAGRPVALSLDATLSALASRKATDLVANFATSAPNNAHGHTDATWAAQWSNGNALSQQFNAAFSAAFGSDNPDSHYQMFVTASPYADASHVLKALETQNGASGAFGDSDYDTIGVGEYGGLWVVIVGTHTAGYAIQASGADGLDALTEYGGPDSDKLYAGTRAAHLYGMAGNDILYGGPGNDVFDGGDGADTVSYAGANAGIFAELDSDSEQNTGGGQGSDTLISIENLIGSSYDDFLDGNSSNNTLTGGSGNDTLSIWQGGNDTASGGAGDDSFSVGAALNAADRLDGDSGNDVLSLQGDYSHGVRFNATTITNIEVITFNPGYSYKIVLNDGNVAAGQNLEVNGYYLGTGDVLNFSGAAETDGNFTIFGGAANDILTGGAKGDYFDLSQGGDDRAAGGGGNDTFYLAGALTSLDRIDGGTGTNTVSLNGDYSSGVTLGTKTLTNIEDIYLTPGHTYRLTSSDATVAAGSNLTVDGSYLGATDAMTFNGSRETDGHFTFDGGMGNNNLTGGAGSDKFVMQPDGFDKIQGGGGNDQIWFGAGLTSGDQIDGGLGSDTLTLNGDYSAGVSFNSHTLLNIEAIGLVGGFSYKFVSADATVAGGQVLVIDASNLGSSNSFTFNGSKETDGRFILIGGAGHDNLEGGAGNDHLTGGLGADTLTGGGGRNTFIYQSAAESTGVSFDTIRDFDTLSDRIDLSVSVIGINSTVTSGALNRSGFDSELSSVIGAAQLAAGHAVLYTPSSGSLSGHTFLIVDANGAAGYQAGSDFVFDITGAGHLAGLVAADFI